MTHAHLLAFAGWLLIACAIGSLLGFGLIHTVLAQIDAIQALTVR